MWAILSPGNKRLSSLEVGREETHYVVSSLRLFRKVCFWTPVLKPSVTLSLWLSRTKPRSFDDLFSLSIFWPNGAELQRTPLLFWHYICVPLTGSKFTNGNIIVIVLPSACIPVQGASSNQCNHNKRWVFNKLLLFWRLFSKLCADVTCFPAWQLLRSLPLQREPLPFRNLRALKSEVWKSFREAQQWAAKTRGSVHSMSRRTRSVKLDNDTL